MRRDGVMTGRHGKAFSDARLGTWWLSQHPPRAGTSTALQHREDPSLFTSLPAPSLDWHVHHVTAQGGSVTVYFPPSTLLGGHVHHVTGQGGSITVYFPATVYFPELVSCDLNHTHFMVNKQISAHDATNCCTGLNGSVHTRRPGQNHKLLCNAL